jgi:hypothetical protein
MDPLLEIVKNPYAIAAVKQEINSVGANETSPPSNKDSIPA